jgi:hypothetical protein
MQRSVLNCATMRVAEKTDLSGRVTADEVNLDRFHNRISKVCAFVAATLILPALAYAQGAPPPQGTSPLAALEAKVTALQIQLTALQSLVNSLQASLTAAQPVLALAPYVSVDPNPENGVAGPNIKFTGANIHILSGSNATDDNLSHGGSLTGRGNLIIGYDEVQFGTLQRGGSHNLVIGRFHSFTSSAFGGLVAGEQNTISAKAASVSGGTNSTASGSYASVSGGASNLASGPYCSISGGGGSIASGYNSSVSGGGSNISSGYFTSVIGGEVNEASSDFSIKPQPPFP